MKYLVYLQKLYDVKKSFLKIRNTGVYTKQLSGRNWNSASLDLAVLGI